MKPEIYKIAHITDNQSVICILGNDHLPEHLLLTKQEKEFANRQLQAKEEFILINSYKRYIYLVRVKEDIPHYKIREELRKTAYNIRKLIRENNHPELVITSNQSYKGAIEDFAEGLTLSFYSFDKYKTIKDREDKKNYPDRLLLSGDISDSEIKWLNDLSDAVYFTRNLICEPVNHLNAETFAKEIKK